MLILVCIYSHSLQVIETCRTCTFYFAKKKKKPLLLSAVKAQMLDTYQPYITVFCKQHLKIHSRQHKNVCKLLTNLFQSFICQWI